VGIAATVLHLAVVAGLLLLLGLFVRSENGGEVWEPWRVAVTAWSGRLDFLHCLKHFGVCGASIVGSISGMAMTAPLFRGAVRLARWPLPAFAHNRCRMARHGLAGLYEATYVPLAWLYVPAFGAIVARLAWALVRANPCCGLFLAICVIFFLTIGVVVWWMKGLTHFARRVQTWVLR